MKVTATTLPRRSLRASRTPSCVVRLNAGAGPIFGRSALSLSQADGRERQPAHHQCYETSSRPSVPHVHAAPSYAQVSSSLPSGEREALTLSL